MDTASKIKQLREARGMTLEELGQKVGVGKSTVRKWETGIIANMRRDKIAKLSDALGVTPAYLMGWEETTTPEPFTLTSQEETLVRHYRIASEGTKESVRKLLDIPEEKGEDTFIA